MRRVLSKGVIDATSANRVAATMAALVTNNI